jgi:hypothetical protein
MRRVWWNAIAAMGAILFGACAAGTDDGDPAAGTWASAGDAGDSSPPSNSPESGSTDTTPAPPVDNDAGTTDSGTMVPPANDAAVPPTMDSGPPPIVDSGTDASATQPDTGTPTTGTTCPNNAKYWGEWLNAPTTATVCTTGAECKPTECCYPAKLGTPLCVPL